jgi:hypothetical protein
LVEGGKEQHKERKKKKTKTKKNKKGEEGGQGRKREMEIFECNLIICFS